MSPDGWRFGDLLREAFRNVNGPSARLFPLLGLAVVTGSGLAAFVAAEAVALRDDVDSLAARGRGVVVYTEVAPTNPALIARTSCERLVDDVRVRAAGSTTLGPRVSIAPGIDEVGSQRVSSTLLPQLAEYDAVVGRDLIDARSPYTALIAGASLRVAPLVPQPEGVANAASLYLPLRPGDRATPTCVVVLEPFARADAVIADHLASLEITGGAVLGTEVLQATSDPVAEYLERPGRYLALLLGTLGAVVTIITYRLRGSELATYRLSGTGSASLFVLMGLELSLITGAAAVAATAASVVLLDRHLLLDVPLWWGLVLAGVWQAGALLGVVDLALRRPTELAKDR